MVTEKLLRAIRPKKGRKTMSIPDGMVPGLAARYGARGAVEFSIVYRWSTAPTQWRQSLGRWWDSRLGPAPSPRYLTLAEARLKALQLREEAAAGKPSLLPFFGVVAVEPGHPTKLPPDAVGHVLSRYAREHLSGLRTGRAFEQLLRTALPADKPIGQITRVDVRAVVDQHMAAGRGHMANRVHASLATFFRWCADRDLLEASPMAGMRRPLRRETSRDRVLTDDEVRLVWFACEMLPPARRDAIRLLLLTGLRRGEVTGLRWSEVGTLQLQIPGERMKNGMLHIVPLVPAALQLIQSQPSQTPRDRVFANLGNLSNAAALVTQSMDIPRWRLHDFRRTFASGLQRLGVRPEVIDRCLAHSAVIRGVAAVYLRATYSDERRAAMTLWAAHVEALLK